MDRVIEEWLLSFAQHYPELPFWDKDALARTPFCSFHVATTPNPEIQVDFSHIQLMSA